MANEFKSNVEKVLTVEGVKNPAAAVEKTANKLKQLESKLKNADTAPGKVPEKADILQAGQMRKVRDDAVSHVDSIRNLESQNARKKLYEKSYGQCSEEFFTNSHGGVNLDQTLHNNFETFDTSTKDELASIKCHVTGKLDGAISGYASDLRTSLGYLEPNKFNTAAQSLLEARNNPQQWAKLKDNCPKEILQAVEDAHKSGGGNLDGIKKAMQDKATLRIPPEDVGRVHDYLDRVVRKTPEIYGIRSDPLLQREAFQAELDKLKDRVKPFTENVSNHQLRLMAKDISQRKMEEAGLPINMNIPSLTPHRH